MSAFLIDDADGVPSSATYRHRFGSLVDAYRMAGYRPERDYEFLQVNHRLQCLYPTLIGDAAARLRARTWLRMTTSTTKSAANDIPFAASSGGKPCPANPH